MNSSRLLLYIAFITISFLLFQAWNQDQAPKPESPSISTTTLHEGSQAGLNLVTLENDVLRLSIDTYGGDIVSAELLKYAKTLKDESPVTVLSQEPSIYTTMITGLYGAQGIDVAGKRGEYSVRSLADENGNKVLTLVYTINNIDYEKIFTLKKDNYEVDVSYNIANNSAGNISVGSFARFKTLENRETKNFAFFGSSSFSGFITSTEEDNYDKVAFSDISKKKFKGTSTQGGWVGLSNHFFLEAWVPPAQSENVIRSEVDSGFIYVNVLSKEHVIAPQTRLEFTNKVWIGPKLQDSLAAVAPNLELTVDYGWAWFIAKPLFTLLSWLQSLINNWGVAIILLTLVVRAALYPLSRIQFRTQAKMRRLSPEVALINQRYAEDRLRKTQEMQKLYREHKVNPLSGCLPLLIQMPIFLSLFYVFSEAVELRHSEFFLWIKDLSAVDPFYILPIINGAVMIFMMRLTPTPEGMDPLQQKIMKYMPYIFVVFFLFLPSGLVLYYTISNLITIIMMLYIFKKVDKEYADNKNNSKRVK